MMISYIPDILCLLLIDVIKNLIMFCGFQSKNPHSGKLDSDFAPLNPYHTKIGPQRKRRTVSCGPMRGNCYLLLPRITFLKVLSIPIPKATVSLIRSGIMKGITHQPSVVISVALLPSSAVYVCMNHNVPRA